MFGSRFNTFSSANKSVLPPNQQPQQEFETEEGQNLTINTELIQESLSSPAELAEAFTEAFQELSAELQNYPTENGQPVVYGAQQLYERSVREVDDLKKAGEIADILISQIQILRAKEMQIFGSIEELKKDQERLAILQAETLKNSDYEEMSQKLQEIEPKGGNIEAFTDYVEKEAIEIAKYIE